MTRKLKPEQRKRVSDKDGRTKKQRRGVVAVETGSDIFEWLVQDFAKEKDPDRKYDKGIALLPWTRAKPKQKYADDESKQDLNVPRLVIEPYSEQDAG